MSALHAVAAIVRSIAADVGAIERSPADIVDKLLSPSPTIRIVLPEV